MWESRKNRRWFLNVGSRLAVFLGAGSVLKRALAASDPRPSFSAQSIEDILEMLFGVREASDDASIDIEAPLEVLQGEWVPFRVSAPGVEKIALLTDAHPEPLIMVLEQMQNHPTVMIGSIRLERNGQLICFAWRDGQLGRAEHPVRIAGTWRELSQ